MLIKALATIGYLILAVIFLIQLLNIFGGGNVVVSAVVMLAIGMFVAIKVQRRYKKTDLENDLK